MDPSRYSNGIRLFFSVRTFWLILSFFGCVIIDKISAYDNVNHVSWLFFFRFGMESAIAVSTHSRRLTEARLSHQSGFPRTASTSCLVGEMASLHCGSYQPVCYGANPDIPLFISALYNLAGRPLNTYKPPKPLKLSYNPHALFNHYEDYGKQLPMTKAQLISFLVNSIPDYIQGFLYS